MRDNPVNSNLRIGSISMPIMPIIFFVVVSLLSLAINPFYKQAQKEEMEQTSLEILQREKPQRLGTILFAVGFVVKLTAFVTVVVYVPLE